MNKAFNISINIMGDLKSRTAQVTISENSNEYDITLPDGDLISVKFSENGELVQTSGTPLDSNTLHCVSQALKNKLD